MYRGLGWAGLDWGLAGIRREFGAGQQDKWALSVQCRLGRERSTYLIHNPMSISNGERERRQGGGQRRRRLMSNSAAGWDGTRQQRGHTCKGWSSEFTDLWWDILNPSTWLLGLPSVGRYDAAGTRPQGRTIYVNHFARALWVRTAAAGKIGPLYRGPFPTQLLPRCRFADGRRDAR